MVFLLPIQFTFRNSKQKLAYIKYLFSTILSKSLVLLQICAINAQIARPDGTFLS